jgi:ubiquinone/menaquinone biosynthesis C-methylase UbiE
LWSNPYFILAMRFLNRILGYFFSLLYHNLAWGYDLVAGIVSMGRWKEWVTGVIPFIAGARILELGHGPGHLQQALLELNKNAVGLDESRQMGNVAKRNLIKGYTQICLVRGLGQDLPFFTECFDTVVATFPAEYIFDRHTLSEVWRVLNIGGRLVILPVAWITGKSPPDRCAAWLFRITGQAPAGFKEEALTRSSEPFRKANFQVTTELLEVKSSQILIIVALKLPPLETNLTT